MEGLKPLQVVLVLLSISAAISKQLDEDCKSMESMDPEGFPTKPSAIRNYKSMFSGNITIAKLMKNVDMETEKALKGLRFQAEMTPKIVEVVPGKVYQAQFFSMSWPVVIVTPEDTLVWVNAPESSNAAQDIIDAFRTLAAIGNKPIAALIYTTSHADHTWGAGPIVNDHNNRIPPVIIAHSELLTEAYKLNTFMGFKTPRLLRQFGTFLPEPPHIHDGSTHRIRFEGPFAITHPPNDILHFEEPDTIISRAIDGLELQFISVPGYTTDQIIVWVPEWKVLHGADVYYESMPNLYTLRGEPGRNVLQWAQGTRKAACFDAEVLVITHSYPIFGAENIRETLVTYADGMQYLHDQTIRYMAKGYPSDVISSVVNLPKNLAEKKMFAPIYGIEETAILSIFDFYVGWFSGFTEDLFRVDRFERGSRLIEMIGRAKMKSEAAKAYNAKEYTWALELATYLWRDDNRDRFALELRTETMKRLAEEQDSIAARNYYLSTVVEDWKLVNNVVMTNTSFIMLHLDGAMQNLQFHLNNELVENVNEMLYVNLSDKDIVFKLTIRNSILDYEEATEVGTEAPTLHIKDTCNPEKKLNVLCWRFLLAGFVSFKDIPPSIITNGTPDDIVHFFSHFDFQDEISGAHKL